MLHAAARLAAIEDELDQLQGQRLDARQREDRNGLLRDQHEARRTFDQAESRVRTMRDLR
jgi:hypothetical protein